MSDTTIAAPRSDEPVAAEDVLPILRDNILADGMFFVLEGKTGMLRLVEANVNEYKELGHAQVLKGPEVWAPLALSDGKLIVRDTAVMKCLQVGAP